MLSSPLRRCLLTNKVLPSDLMVRFELTRPPASPSSNARFLLQPSRILHPRFEDRRSREGATGKAMWVTCWSEAVSTLAQKGSYKRLNSAAAMPPPRAVTAHVHSLLARRVVHEADLVAERVKAWPATWATRAEDAPVRRCTVGQVQSAVEDAARRGRRVMGVLDTSPSGAGAGAGPVQPFSSALTVPSRHPPTRTYCLSQFLHNIVLPPSALVLSPSADADADADEASSPGTHVLAATRAPLDGLIALLARRFARTFDPSATATSVPVAPEEEEGDAFVLSAPCVLPGMAAAADAVVQRRQAEDLVPLLVALERCRLWSGEGWEAEGEEQEAPGTATTEGRQTPDGVAC
ncbi:hypothetical protein JCM3770_002416 [Rhodotorula araucariae]